MADFTLLELHLEDAEISSNAPFLGSDTSAETDDEESGGGKGAMVAVALLVVLVAVGAAVGVKRYRSDSEAEPFDDL